MNCWKEYKLEDIASLIDYRGKTPTKTTSGVPLITAKIVKNGAIEKPTEFISHDDYPKWMTRGYPQIGDVVMTTEAPLGEVAQLKDNQVALAQRIITMRGHEGILNNGYLKYFLQSENGQARLKARETGTTVTGIKQSELKKVLIPLPDIQTQKAIAEILSSLDDKIELNNQINANLEALSQAIFKQWFIDFEFPDENGNPYKSSGGKMVESERGLIPESWKTGSIRDLVKYGNETMNVGNLTLENYISTENMVQDYGGITIASSLPSTKTVKAFSKNDILVSNIRPYFKKIFLPPFAGGCSADVIVFVPNSSLYSDYAYQAMRNDTFFAYVMTGARGTKMPRGDKSHIIKFPVTIPSDSVLEFFSDISRSFSLKIQENTRENQGLASLRDVLIPQLITGKIQIQL